MQVRYNRETMVVPLAPWKREFDSKIAGEPDLFTSQFPCDMGFAVTFHKVQGATLDKVVLTINSSSVGNLAVTLEQLYVGLSRVKRLSDVRILFSSCPVKRTKDLVKISNLQSNHYLRLFKSLWHEETGSFLWDSYERLMEDARNLPRVELAVLQERHPSVKMEELVVKDKVLLRWLYHRSKSPKDPMLYSQASLGKFYGSLKRLAKKGREHLMSLPLERQEHRRWHALRKLARIVAGGFHKNTGITGLPGWRKHPQFVVYFATVFGVVMGPSTSYTGMLPSSAWALAKKSRKGGFHPKDLAFLRKSLALKLSNLIGRSRRR